MTDLHTAARQALAVLDSIGCTDMYAEQWQAVEKLRAALAAQPAQEAAAPRPFDAVKLFANSVLKMLDERIEVAARNTHPFMDKFGDHPETIVAAKAQASELREVRNQVRILGDRALVELMKFKPASQAPTAEAVAPMTARRAVYFMERFKHEEKLLGPNEQAALDYVIAMLEAAPQPATAQPAATEDDADELTDSDITVAAANFAHSKRGRSASGFVQGASWARSYLAAKPARPAPAAGDEASERAAFERDMRAPDVGFTDEWFARHHDDSYESPEMQYRWEGWQARAARSQSLDGLRAENERLHRQNAALLAAKQKAEANERATLEQERKPLTPEQIDKIYRDIPNPVQHWQLARAIEAAHLITAAPGGEARNG